MRFKKIELKSSLSPKKGSSPTTVYCAGTSFNAVVVWTVHSIDHTKDGFTNPAKVAFRTNREIADLLGLIQVSNTTIDCCCLFFLLTSFFVISFLDNIKEESEWWRQACNPGKRFFVRTILIFAPGRCWKYPARTPPCNSELH
jgi:hypothetical protein